MSSQLKFGHLAQRLFNTPLAIHPGKAEVILAALADRLGIAHVTVEGGFQMLDCGDDGYEDSFDRRCDAREDHGFDRLGPIARIPVEGTLVQKLGSLRPWSGMTGYDGIRHAFLAAISDPDIEGIIFDIDSPGGEVAGCFDLGDLIYSMRGTKPIGAILTESAYSAAYLLCSAVDPGRVWVPRTGGVGSIGVIWMHVDYSQAYKNGGINVSILKKGLHKADGSSVIPLSDDARARFQADIDETGELFIETVARNRNLSVKAVSATEAATFMGPKGVELGLADAVMAPDAAFRAFLQSFS